MEERRDEYALDDGRTVVSHRWCFSETEKETLKRFLQGYDRQAVSAFIDQLERDFSLMYYLVFEGNQRTKADQIKALHDMISGFERAFKDASKISSGRFLPLPFRKCITQDDAMEKKDIEENRRWEINDEARLNAETLREPLRRVIGALKSAIEKEKLKPGQRRRADELNLASVVGKEFKKYFGMPRRGAGQFASVVDYCYEIVTKRKNDRSRAVRQAIKELYCI